MDNLQQQQSNTPNTVNPQSLNQQQLLNTDGSLQNTPTTTQESLSKIQKSAGLSVQTACGTNCSGSVVSTTQADNSLSAFAPGVAVAAVILVVVVAVALMRRKKPALEETQQEPIEELEAPVLNSPKDTPQQTPKKSKKPAKRKKRY